VNGAEFELGSLIGVELGLESTGVTSLGKQRKKRSRKNK
jgi:hypothetical protein